MLAWIKSHPADLVRAMLVVIGACFAAGVAWASVDSRIERLELAMPALSSDVREARDLARALCVATAGCSPASPRP